jgi:hypothetical protein
MQRAVPVDATLQHDGSPEGLRYESNVPSCTAGRCSAGLQACRMDVRDELRYAPAYAR